MVWHKRTYLTKTKKSPMMHQVAYYLYDEKVIEREFGAFANVPDNFPKYVLSFDKMDFSREGIIHKNILEFLLEV